MPKFALVVGVAEYSRGPGQLPPARNDAEKIHEILKSDGYILDDEPVINPTWEELLVKIEDAIALATSVEDTFLFYFSGHGVRTPGGSYFLTASNSVVASNTNFKQSTLISYSGFLNPLLSNCKAGGKVLIIDACYSGAMITTKKDVEVALPKVMFTCGAAILTSCNSVEESHTEDTADGLSVYTRFLIEGIETSAADENGDGVITSDELQRYIMRRFDEDPKYKGTMHPDRDYDKDGHRVPIVASKKALQNRYQQFVIRTSKRHLAVEAKEAIAAQRDQFFGNLDLESKLKIEGEILDSQLAKESEYRKVLKQELLRSSFPFNPHTVDKLKSQASRLGLTKRITGEIERCELSTFKQDSVKGLEEYLEQQCRKQLVQHVRSHLDAIYRSFNVDHAIAVKASENILSFWESREVQYADAVALIAGNDGIFHSPDSKEKLSKLSSELEFDALKVTKIVDHYRKKIDFELRLGFEREVLEAVQANGTQRSNFFIAKISRKYGLDDITAKGLAQLSIDEVEYYEQEFRKAFKKFLEHQATFEVTAYKDSVKKIAQEIGISISLAEQLSDQLLEQNAQIVESLFAQELENLDDTELSINSEMLENVKSRFRIHESQKEAIVRETLQKRRERDVQFQAKYLDFLASKTGTSEDADTFTVALSEKLGINSKRLAQLVSACQNEYQARSIEKLKSDIQAICQTHCREEALRLISETRKRFQSVPDSATTEFVSSLTYAISRQEIELHKLYSEIIKTDGIVFSDASKRRWRLAAEQMKIGNERLESIRRQFEKQSSAALVKLCEKSLLHGERFRSKEEVESFILDASIKYGVALEAARNLFANAEKILQENSSKFLKTYTAAALMEGPHLLQTTKEDLVALQKELGFTERHAAVLIERKNLVLETEFQNKYSQEMENLYNSEPVAIAMSTHEKLQQKWRISETRAAEEKKKQLQKWQAKEFEYLDLYKKRIIEYGFDLPGDARHSLIVYSKSLQLTPPKVSKLEDFVNKDPYEIKTLLMDKLTLELGRSGDCQIDMLEAIATTKLNVPKETFDEILLKARQTVLDRQLEYHAACEEAMTLFDVLSPTARKTLDKLAAELQIDRDKQEMLEKQYLDRVARDGKGLCYEEVPVSLKFICVLSAALIIGCVIIATVNGNFNQVPSNPNSLTSTTTTTATTTASTTSTADGSGTTSITVPSSSENPSTTGPAAAASPDPASSSSNSATVGGDAPKEAWITAGTFSGSTDTILDENIVWLKEAPPKQSYDNKKVRFVRDVEPLVETGDIVTVDNQGGKPYLWLCDSPNATEKHIYSYRVNNGSTLRVLKVKPVGSGGRVVLWLLVEPENDSANTFEYKERSKASPKT